MTLETDLLPPKDEEGKGTLRVAEGRNEGETGGSTLPAATSSAQPNLDGREQNTIFQLVCERLEAIGGHKKGFQVLEWTKALNKTLKDVELKDTSDPKELADSFRKFWLDIEEGLKFVIHGKWIWKVVIAEVDRLTLSQIYRCEVPKADGLKEIGGGWQWLLRSGR